MYRERLPRGGGRGWRRAPGAALLGLALAFWSPASRLVAQEVSDRQADTAVRSGLEAPPTEQPVL
ncbi:MAG: hypothetical protein O6851_01460, partial [Gemmatimonadetes bacterium]|nr:hypothetical protein [Gemmatimonadota bacterium]